jgi:hypothetical protein
MPVHPSQRQPEHPPSEVELPDTPLAPIHPAAPVSMIRPSWVRVGNTPALIAQWERRAA